MPPPENLSSIRPELREKCGVFGAFTPNKNSAPITLDGIRELQHRGQDSAGIASISGERIFAKRGEGLVDDVFPEGSRSVQNLKGVISAGHTRYGTSFGEGGPHLQPVFGDSGLILAHNGNIADTGALQRFFDAKGIPINGRNDSELMHGAVQYYMEKGAPVEEALIEAIPMFHGAWSIVMADRKSHSLIGARDGMRPLSMNQDPKGVYFGSETRAFKNPQGSKDVEPGTIVLFDGTAVRTESFSDAATAFDIFEILYLMKPDSIIFGQRVGDMRVNLGKALGQEIQNEVPIHLDAVVGIPETALPSAMGFAQETGVPQTTGFIKNIKERTFISADEAQRGQMVKDKLMPVPENVRGKDIALVDDTIVRGTTTGVAVNLLREAGANSIHLYIPSGPIQYPDYYGVNIRRQKELIANRYGTPEELAKALGADTIHYLSVEGMVRATGVPRERLSISAFTGEYPIDIGERRNEVRHVSPLRLHSHPSVFAGTR